MTPAKFATLVRFYTKTNSTSFTDTEILMLANLFKDEIANEVGKKVGEDYFGLRLTTDLVEDQREYGFPSEVMARIKYAEAKLDGTNWVKMGSTDLAQYELPTDEANIVAAYAGKAAEIDIWDKSFFIYSDAAIIDVTDGLKIWAIVFPADITDLASVVDMSENPSATSHGFPRQFHELLARAVSIAWKTSQPRPIPLSEPEKLYRLDLNNALDSLKETNLDQEFVAEVAVDNGENY